MGKGHIKVETYNNYLKNCPNFTGSLIDLDGDVSYFNNGLKHRKKGPAVIWANGTKMWYKNGYHHRENGPAIEYTDGDKRWYFNGQEYTEQEHRVIVRRIKLNLLDQ